MLPEEVPLFWERSQGEAYNGNAQTKNKNNVLLTFNNEQ
jgi:hypothetical protein